METQYEVQTMERDGWDTAAHFETRSEAHAYRRKLERLGHPQVRLIEVEITTQDEE